MKDKVTYQDCQGGHHRTARAAYLANEREGYPNTAVTMIVKSGSYTSRTPANACGDAIGATRTA